MFKHPNKGLQHFKLQKLRSPKLPKYRSQLLEKAPEPKPAIKTSVKSPNIISEALVTLRKELVVQPEFELVNVGLKETEKECHELIREQSEFGFGGKTYAVTAMTVLGIGALAMGAMLTALIYKDMALANIFAWIGVLTMPTGFLGMVGPQIISQNLGERARKWLNSIDPLERRMDQIGRELPLLIETHSDLVAELAKESK